jgi:hypothetical protein
MAPFRGIWLVRGLKPDFKTAAVSRKPSLLRDDRREQLVVALKLREPPSGHRSQFEFERRPRRT